ncbi:MAG: stage V sporulation protein E [Planctomycetota bacterium]
MGRRRATPARAPGGSTERLHVPELDWLMLSVVALCCLGLVMSVSIVGAHDQKTTTLAVMKAQGSKLLVGLVAFLCCALIPIGLVRRLGLPLFAVGTAACAATRFLFPPVHHAYRWIVLGGHSFQPVELARFALVIATADLLARAGRGITTFGRGFLPVMGCAVLLAASLLVQPDHGNAILVICLASCTALIAGVRFLHFVPLAVAGIGLVMARASSHSYVMDRLAGFLSVKPGSQVGQGLVALASGGAFGRGLGQGWMKMGFVPEARNDFVFAIVGEELGYAGSLLVLLLFTTIGFVGYRLVLSMRDPFLRLLVCGFTLLICMQAAVNLMVVSGWAPAKGIDLPFVSTGGSSLVFFLAATGLIGNAARTDFTSGRSVPSNPGRV